MPAMRGFRFEMLLIACALLCGALGLACGADRAGPLDAAGMRGQVAAALREADTLARAAALVPLLQRLDAGNVAGAAAAVDERLTVIDDADLRLFLHAWAAFDPQAALDHALAWPLRSKREFGAGQVIYAWARREGAGDAQFNLDSLAEPGLRRAARSELVRGWAGFGDYEGVTAYVSALPQGDLRDHYVTLIVGAIVADQGSEGALRWADAVPEDAEGGFKQTTFRKVLRHVSVLEPEKAATWYESQAERSYADLGMSVVATEWVERDPERAFAWLLSQPPGGRRDMAMRFALRRWLDIDAQAAEAWLRSGERSEEFAPALDTYALWLVQRDPAEAVQWAERIPDEAQRARVLSAASRRWQVTDPDAFRAWFAQVELPEDTKAALLRRRTPAPREARAPAAQEESAP